MAGVFATMGNSAIQMLTSPVMQFGRLERERRRPIILLLSLVWALAVTLGISLMIIYWWMTGWYAATQSLEKDTAPAPPEGRL